MIYRHLLILAYIGLLTQFAVAQEPSAFLSQSFYGYSGDDECHSILLNQQGALTLVGYANPPRKSGKDLFLIIDNGIYTDTIVHGRQGDESANEFVQTTDGRYAIVGFSTSEAKGYQGGTDGLFLIISEDGKTVLRDTLLGSKDDDELFDITIGENNCFYLTGKKNDALWILKMDTNGNVIWEKTWAPKWISQGSALTRLESGDIAVVGYSLDKNNSSILHFCKLDTAGNFLVQKSFPGDRGFDIMESLDHNVFITGIAPEQRQNLLLLKLDPAGNVLWRKHHQGNYLYDNLDAGHALIYNQWKEICIVGINSSYKRGMNRNLGWLSFYDEKGEMLRDTLLGGNSEDNLRAICIAKDGSLAIAGYSASGKKLKRDAWLVRFAPPKSIPNQNRHLKITDLKMENGKENVLRGGEERAFSFKIRNTHQLPLSGVQVNIVVEGEQAKNVQLPSTQFIAAIAAGEVREVSFSVSGSEGMDEGKVSIQVSITGSQETLHSIEIPTKRRDKPILQLSLQKGDSFKTQDGGLPTRGEIVRLDFEIENRGNIAARNLNIQLVLPDQIEIVTAGRSKIDRLEPGQSEKLTLNFRVTDTYFKDLVEIKALVHLVNRTLIDQQAYSLELKPFRAITDNYSREPQESVANNQNRLIWLSPTADEVIRGEVVTADSIYNLKLIAYSSQALAENNFLVYHNGDLINRGARSQGLYVLASPKNASETVKEFSYTLVLENLQLDPGKNTFKVELLSNAGSITSDELIISYRLKKPNLHILSIGVPHNDLEYTTMDARDFSEALITQEGKLFERVFTKILTRKEETSTLELRKHFRDLVYDYKGNRIREGDVVIVFISTHGLTDSKREVFRLVGSDYDALYAAETSVDYEKDLADVLEEMNCTKIVFIDACQSGGINYVDAGLTAKNVSDDRRDLGEALTHLMASDNRLRAIASCQENELSYEDKNWSNGAFTEAILEAFTNASVQISKQVSIRASEDDNVLTLAELHLFLKLRVPYLVSKKSEAKTTQTPFLSEEFQKENLPFFYFDK